MSEIRNPHDLFFKETFSRLEVARNFLAEYLPPEVTAVLNLESLELQKDTFIDSELREHFSDLLYRVQLNDGNNANIYMLLEHKSSPDALVGLQLLRYMVQHWENARKEKISPLPPIIPIVVYHGRDKWQVAENFGSLFEGPESLERYWPKFNYELQDFSPFSAAEIRGTIILRVGLLLLAGSHDPMLLKRLPRIFQMLDELKDGKTALEYLEVALRYLSASAKNISDEQITTALEEAFKDNGESIMAGFVEKWIEHGKQEGLQEGLQLGKLEGQQALRSAIINLLQVRFEVIPSSIGNELGTITNLALLQQLHFQAATAESLTAFEDYMASLDT